MTNLTSLTFGESGPCDHVMVDLLSSALRTLQQAHLLAGVFPSKVVHVIITCVVKLFWGWGISLCKKLQWNYWTLY